MTFFQRRCTWRNDYCTFHTVRLLSRQNESHGNLLTHIWWHTFWGEETHKLKKCLIPSRNKLPCIYISLLQTWILNLNDQLQNKSQGIAIMSLCRFIKTQKNAFLTNESTAGSVHMDRAKWSTPIEQKRREVWRERMKRKRGGGQRRKIH